MACRDYPHSRHLCLKYPFDTTPHENFCHMVSSISIKITPLGSNNKVVDCWFFNWFQCYCYVCDSVAPCKYWEDPKSAHCHASEHIDAWKLKRSLGKNQPPPCSWTILPFIAMWVLLIFCSLHFAATGTWNTQHQMLNILLIVGQIHALNLRFGQYT